jgi:hypothetical protein
MRIVCGCVGSIASRYVEETKQRKLFAVIVTFVIVAFSSEFLPPARHGFDEIIQFCSRPRCLQKSKPQCLLVYHQKSTPKTKIDQSIYLSELFFLPKFVWIPTERYKPICTC